MRKKLAIKPTPIHKEILDDEKEAQKKKIFDEIESLLLEKKLFTEPKLTVEFLTNEVDINAAKLSNIIKLFSENSFNEYINEFRIELAKELLLDENYKNYTITAIGLESGFNSKSTFYSTFKKHTGNTPSAYQKTIKK